MLCRTVLQCDADGARTSACCFSASAAGQLGRPLRGDSFLLIHKMCKARRCRQIKRYLTALKKYTREFVHALGLNAEVHLGQFYGLTVANVLFKSILCLLQHLLLYRREVSGTTKSSLS